MPKPKLLTHFTDTPQHKGDLFEYLGGKGANLNRMARELQLPVPEGFTIPTVECLRFTETGKLRPSLTQAIWTAIERVEDESGRGFGDSANPLLLSVRSGAKFSMPGMMETILNLGLNSDTVEGLAKNTSDDFAWDSYRRFVQMYASIVGGVPEELFYERVKVATALCGGKNIDAEVSQLLVNTFKKIAKSHGVHIPSSPRSQLRNAVQAVFKSWYADKAQSYRKIEGIPDDLGTAVNIQRMVFGNLNNSSATGVAFSRNPNNGDKVVYGDFLVNAQGEDVVAGTHKTSPLADIHTAFPSVGVELNGILDVLERELRDMVDIEFTIEDGKLYMLQARVGKRNPQAAVKIATEMLSEGLIDIDESKARIDAAHENWTEPSEAESIQTSGNVIATGLPASPGKVRGVVALSSKDAVELADEGNDVILVRYATDPSDIEGMSKSVGILTQTGGLVSHAAVVARGWGKACVVNSSISIASGYFTASSQKVKAGERIVIDGTTGEVWKDNA